MEYDYLIENTKIVEGTGKKAYTGSIGVKDDQIAALGKVKGDAVNIINAKGLTAFPGFIDAHSHADWALLWYPETQSHVMQGITTFVGGQCGGSPAPLGEHIRVPWLLQDHLMKFEPYKYYPRQPYYPLETVNEWMDEIYGWTLDWDTMGDYFKHVENKGISINYAPLVGHGSIRTKVMGLDYKKNSTKEERDEMHELVHQAMKDGCIGMSTGLDYDPDVFASHDEIVLAVSQMKEYGGVYCPHWRRTGRRRGISAGHVPNEKIKALLECVDVYEKTGVRLHFAHLSTGWQIYPDAPPELEEANLRVTIDKILEKSKGDLDITWDAIPFLVRGGFSVMPYLCGLLEPWLRELGGREELGKWLDVPEFRDEVFEAIRDGKWFIRVAYNPNTNPHWAKNLYVTKSEVEDIDGKSVQEVAEMWDLEPWDAYCDIIVKDPHTRGVTGSLTYNTAYDQYYTHPKGMVGLDTMVNDDEYQRESPPYSIPGINSFAAYPIFFNKFVKEKKTFTLEEAAQKTSAMAAKVHNLKGRGALMVDGFADIVLMDLPNLNVTADEIEPRRYPEGIEYVFVNGETVVKEGKHTGARPGRVLRRE
ncbi:amidohydrolase family protein [Candidatus Bathyarchaeota archaeon]|nr:amidohydrolase family protein [Candidatus Bathyarchaeota archaeon]